MRLSSLKGGQLRRPAFYSGGHEPRSHWGLSLAPGAAGE
jgi:hypothetical protein